MHLNPEELVDFADGTRSDASAPHLASCASCRQRVADLRATLASVAEVDIPEPSPLFWDHFSRRVHDAVAAEEPRRWWGGTLVPAGWMRIAAPIAGIVVIMLLAFAVRVLAPQPMPARLATAPSVRPPSRLEPPVRETLDEVTDPSLTLVADMADGIGWDAEHEAGLAPRGSAEHAVAHLNDAELRELQRLLKVELAHATD